MQAVNIPHQFYAGTGGNPIKEGDIGHFMPRLDNHLDPGIVVCSDEPVSCALYGRRDFPGL